jgi:threonine synthase
LAYPAHGLLLNSTFFTHLSCSGCERTLPGNTVQTVCPSCGKALLAEYDLLQAKKEMTPRNFGARGSGLWRYRRFLPVQDDSAIVSLGEGWTPLIHTVKLGHELGLNRLYIKDEGFNPTGSFKARGLALAVSRAAELGIREVAMPSAGNAGGALAAFAAKAGIRAHIFVPRDTPLVNIKEASLYGAEVELVDGLISDAAKRMNERKRGTGWFDMSTMKEPYRLEGKKTMGFEIAEQFGWELPDLIIYPTGGGTGLIGIWNAFRELGTLGWIPPHRPRMVCVQAEGCAPIVRAFREHRNESAFWEGAQTVASGLRVPKAFADTMILRALSESLGCAVSVSDDEILREMKHVASLEGVFLCPEGAAAVAAARNLTRDRVIQPSDRVLVLNTGSGYKYVELFAGMTHKV